jgi:hypothetical protein
MLNNNENDSNENDSNENDSNENDSNENDSNANNSVHKIVTTMANMINYLNVSLYEGQFTYKHEQARAKINAIYDAVSKMQFLAPSLHDSSEFYNNVKCLHNVTDTDDPDYYLYMRELKKI